MTYHDVLDKILDTGDATVGGGSAAALSGAMAAGLIGMAALLPVGKGGLADETCRQVEARCKELRARLLAGCVDDTSAYSGIVAAYKLPKATEEEKRARSQAIQVAGAGAAAVPRDTGRGCRDVYALGLSIREGYNKNAASDFEYGMELAALGIRGAIANIEANLPLIKDEAVRAEFLADIAELKEDLKP